MKIKQSSSGVLLWLALSALSWGEDTATLLDAAATAQRREYLVARDRVIALGVAAAPELERIQSAPEVPWQRRVMARICLERIQRRQEIDAFLDYDWRQDPELRDHRDWRTRIGFPREILKKGQQRLQEAGLLGLAFELAWKDAPEQPNAGGTYEWSRVGRGILLEKRDSDFILWAREELEKVKPFYIDNHWAYKALLQLKDHAALPKMFDLWLQARPRFYEISYKGDLEGGSTPEQARRGGLASSTGMLIRLLPLATPADVTWIAQKLQGIELHESAQEALSKYLASAGDTTPPVITILGANPVTIECGGVYADAGATATDDKDGNITSRIVVENNVDTPKVGTYQVIYRVTDAAGNAATATRTVKVVYKFDGFLPPIGGADATGGTYDQPVKTFKLGSTIPVKFQISCGGTAVKAGVHTLQVIKYNNATTAAEPIDATPTDAATTGNQFKLAGDEWHFNLDTKATGMSTGTWQLKATLSDGSVHLVWIGLK